MCGYTDALSKCRIVSVQPGYLPQPESKTAQFARYSAAHITVHTYSIHVCN
jgi:hypothetical protein